MVQRGTFTVIQCGFHGTPPVNIVASCGWACQDILYLFVPNRPPALPQVDRAANIHQEKCCTKKHSQYLFLNDADRHKHTHNYIIQMCWFWMVHKQKVTITTQIKVNTMWFLQHCLCLMAMPSHFLIQSRNWALFLTPLCIWSVYPPNLSVMLF